MKKLITTMLALIVIVSSCKPEKSQEQLEKEYLAKLGSGVFQKIDAAYANAIIDNYEKQHRTLESNPAIEDTKSVWIPINSLLAFAARVKLKGGNGVRLYFAAYSPTPNAAIKPGYEGRTTLVFVGTKKHQENFENLLGDKKMSFDGIDPNGLDPYNHGTLCPPDICDGNNGKITPQHK